jgi:hypothetical protein
MKTDQTGWNGCAHVLCTLQAKCPSFRNWNDRWNDAQEMPADQPFQVERSAQGDPTLGVSLGADSTPFRSISFPIQQKWNGSRTDLNLNRQLLRTRISVTSDKRIYR